MFLMKAFKFSREEMEICAKHRTKRGEPGFRKVGGYRFGQSWREDFLKKSLWNLTCNVPLRAGEVSIFFLLFSFLETCQIKQTQ